MKVKVKKLTAIFLWSSGLMGFSLLFLSGAWACFGAGARFRGGRGLGIFENIPRRLHIPQQLHMLHIGIGPDGASLMTPAAGVLLGLTLVWVHLLLTRGYKKRTFFAATLCGTALVLWSVGLLGAVFTAGVSLLPGFRRITDGTGTAAALINRFTGAAALSRIQAGMVLLTGGGLLLAGRIIMTRPVVPSRYILRGLAAAAFVAPAVVLLLAGPGDGNGVPGNGGSADGYTLTYQGELDRLMALLQSGSLSSDPGNYEDAMDYVDEITRDDTLDEDEKRRRIAELSERVRGLEAEIERFEAARREQQRELSREIPGATPGETPEQNDTIIRQKEEIARLQELLQETREALAANKAVKAAEQVTGYREAVRPAAPEVRDFAVNLASQHPGSYHRSARAKGVPSPEGVRQIIAIHRFIADNWKYVNDPLIIQGNYYSPADRTIALGLAGDCDDFAILLASCIEAVGGLARILHGTCGDYAHAWCEVYIGGRREWQEALAIIRKVYPGRSISYIEPGPDGGYWLSLDWQLGVYTCGDNPVLHYQSGR